MEEPGKRMRSNGAGAGGSVAGDRLSALPDSLIHRIMSFMKARQVVQTCVLSKRWTHLWRSVPCLDLDQAEFEPAPSAGGHDEAWHKFEDFSVILLGNHVSIGHLDTFKLSVGGYLYFGEGGHASSWIRRAIKYGTQGPGVQRERLNNRPWRLRRLHLFQVHLDEIFAEHLRSGCPSLENLDLSCCACDFRAITSDSLKNLSIDFCRCQHLPEISSSTLKSLFIDTGVISTNCRLVVTAPDLACLHLITKHHFGGVSLNEMASLAKATILLWGDKTEQSEIRGNQLKILCSVSNVTSLVLLNFEMMVSVEDSKIFPEFKNLRTLTLKGCDISHDCQISRIILQNSPKLESLTLQSCKMFGEESHSFPEFRNLNVLSLRNCDLSDDFWTLGHFLQSSSNLRDLTLWDCKFVDDSKKKKGASKSKKNPPSQCHNLVGVRCENLEHTKIVYTDDNIPQLIELLLHTAGNFPNNSIKLTKIGSR